jgi:hypothetical protein
MTANLMVLHPADETREPARHHGQRRRNVSTTLSGRNAGLATVS